MKGNKGNELMIGEDDIFHVHTYRCGHAEEVPDEAYIQKALALGASGIWFADHAPFPGDPFGNRMSYEGLSEYIATLSELKKKYQGKISVKIGLEVEFFPKFISYYEDLKAMQSMDFLLLGQHMYSTGKNTYSFQLSSEQKNREEYLGLGLSIMEGTHTGLFDVVAHPDRIFKRRKNQWDSNLEAMSRAIIRTAASTGIILEKNLESMHRKHCYRDEFWQMVQPDISIIYGIDAHSLAEMEEKWKMQQDIIGALYLNVTGRKRNE